MASTVNKVILIGNLGDDVKMHYFEGGNSVGRFPIATSESYTSKQTGEKIINTDWHNIVVRNKLAEICEKYLSRGDKVYLEGKLKNKQWEQDGVKRYSTEVHVNEMTFLTTKKSLETTNIPQQKQQTTADKKAVTPDKKDDLPF
ncbi:single-stranded DNA-binding protein [Polaribacter glomeratus]|uniref:Single-stranded DNA-binding protein n=1 Tax=Polaribacter glomeratus TaxID=102 RepID=A0A2S7WHG1_9FLAO|nr:single-stranded DNA-binding protein [Polaribacter glomeratus]PQJ77035.1 single-stranded DNA-binding protein [Polaribacter glomeratus]TXD67115.1 single-stranded DNA-binding protein [Polaribacter glomeratus]